MAADTETQDKKNTFHKEENAKMQNIIISCHTWELSSQLIH